MNDTLRLSADNIYAPILPSDNTGTQQDKFSNQASEKASHESWLDAARHFVHHPLQDTEEGVLDLAHGALYASVQVPVDGAVQLTNHLFDKEYKAPALVTPPAEQNLATKIGETAGSLIDVAVLSQAVGGAVAAAGLTAGPTLGGAVLVGAVTMGITGVIAGAVSPVDERDGFWGKKAEQIAVDGAAFGTMGGMAPMASTIFGTGLIGRTVGGAVSGATASSAQNFTELAFGDDQDGWANMPKAALYGAAFGVASWAMDSVKDNAKNWLSLNSEKAAQAAFEEDPIHNPPGSEDPALGKWSSSTDKNGNTLWSRTYQRTVYRDPDQLTFVDLDNGANPDGSSVQTLSDSVLVRQNGTKEYAFGKNNDSPFNYRLRTITRPDGSFEGDMPNSEKINGVTYGPRKVIDHADGTRLTFEEDKITVRDQGGKTSTNNGSPRIIRSQAETFPDKYIVNQLEAADKITDGLQLDKPGKSVLPDGTKITVDEKGGAAWVVKPDGLVIIKNPNGSKFVGLPDGTEIRVDGHGGIKAKYPH